MDQKPTVVDIFCGAGGLSLGCVTAGFNVVASYDNWLAAVTTYRANFADHIEQIDITEVLDLPTSDVILGGPPCQGFSSAGMRRHDDSRNTLVRVFAQLVARHKPKAFLFENVEGFLTGANGKFVFDLLEPVVTAGYRVHLRKINAANYGVPQHRKRVIAIGGLGWDPSFPDPTHSAFGAPGAHLAGRHLPTTPTLGEALAGLPAAVPRESANGTFDHGYAPLNPEDLKRAKMLKPGHRMRDLPQELWHDSYRRRAFRRVMDGTPTERRGGAPSGLRRLRHDEPSKAVTGGAVNEFLHPTEHRSLTMRECARLQTFPDDFRFIGSPTEVIQQIGNAVPATLAESLARSLLHDLRTAVIRHDRGALLSFIPTLSTGMSPALRDVTQGVMRRFLAKEAREQLTLRWP